MKFFVIAALIAAASAAPQFGIYPPGLSPAACPNYPYCTAPTYYTGRMARWL